MVSSSAFKAKNAQGKPAELRIASVFMTQGWWVRMPQVGARWDLVVGKDDLCENIEIKNEEKYESSGAICVELGQGNPVRASGISISESTFYIHYFGDRSLVLRTRAFQLFLDGIRRGERLQNFAGADNNNCGYLIKRSRFMGLPWAREVALSDIPKAVEFLRTKSIGF